MKGCQQVDDDEDEGEDHVICCREMNIRMRRFEMVVISRELWFEQISDCDWLMYVIWVNWYRCVCKRSWRLLWMCTYFPIEWLCSWSSGSSSFFFLYRVDWNNLKSDGPVHFILFGQVGSFVRSFRSFCSFVRSLCRKLECVLLHCMYTYVVSLYFF
jgi:hypothetical protein